MHVSRHFNTQALTETEKGKEWKSFACIVMPWMEDKEGAFGGRKCPSMVCVVESFTINSVDWRQFDIFIVRHISNTFQKQRASGNFQLLMHRGESVNFKRAEWRKRKKSGSRNLHLRNSSEWQTLWRAARFSSGWDRVGNPLSLGHAYPHLRYFLLGHAYLISHLVEVFKQSYARALPT
jgi:hypothetical protein